MSNEVNQKRGIGWPAVGLVLGLVGSVLAVGVLVVVGVWWVVTDTVGSAGDAVTEPVAAVYEDAKSGVSSAVTSVRDVLRPEVRQSVSSVIEASSQERRLRVATWEGRISGEWVQRRDYLYHAAVRAAAPVRYPYYIELGDADRWGFRVRGQTVEVTVPAPTAGEPNLDLAELDEQVTNRSIFLNERRMLDEARPLLVAKAREQAAEMTHSEEIAAMAKASVRGFARDVLSKAGATDVGDYEIVVVWAEPTELEQVEETEPSGAE